MSRHPAECPDCGRIRRKILLFTSRTWHCDWCAEFEKEKTAPIEMRFRYIGNKDLQDSSFNGQITPLDDQSDGVPDKELFADSSVDFYLKTKARLDHINKRIEYLLSEQAIPRVWVQNRKP